MRAPTVCHPVESVTPDDLGSAVSPAVSKRQEGYMDLWATLGLSQEAGIGVVSVGLVMLVLIAGRLIRRSRRQERVWVDLSGRR